MFHFKFFLVLVTLLGLESASAKTLCSYMALDSLDPAISRDEITQFLWRKFKQNLFNEDGTPTRLITKISENVAKNELTLVLNTKLAWGTTPFYEKKFYFAPQDVVFSLKRKITTDPRNLAYRLKLERHKRELNQWIKEVRVEGTDRVIITSLVPLTELKRKLSGMQTAIVSYEYFKFLESNKRDDLFTYYPLTFDKTEFTVKNKLMPFQDLVFTHNGEKHQILTEQTMLSNDVGKAKNKCQLFFNVPETAKNELKLRFNIELVAQGESQAWIILNPFFEYFKDITHRRQVINFLRSLPLGSQSRVFNAKLVKKVGELLLIEPPKVAPQLTVTSPGPGLVFLIPDRSLLAFYDHDLIGRATNSEKKANRNTKTVTVHALNFEDNLGLGEFDVALYVVKDNEQLCREGERYFSIRSCGTLETGVTLVNAAIAMPLYSYTLFRSNYL